VHSSVFGRDGVFRWTSFRCTPHDSVPMPADEILAAAFVHGLRLRLSNLETNVAVRNEAFGRLMEESFLYALSLSRETTAREFASRSASPHTGTDATHVDAGAGSISHQLSAWTGRVSATVSADAGATASGSSVSSSPTTVSSPSSTSLSLERRLCKKPRVARTDVARASPCGRRT
jgi:hypothetical protein